MATKTFVNETTIPATIIEGDARLTLVGNATASNTPDTLVKRDAAARFKAANPAVAQDVATKDYVDNAITTPATHAATHSSGGTDQVTVSNLDGNLTQARSHDSVDTDTAPTSLHHTLGTGANQATAGNDSRLTDARTPTTHAATHSSGGTDQITVLNLDGNLTQARSHDSADTDVGATSLHHTLGTTANQAAAGNDARFSDSRAPTSHASTHISTGADAIPDATITQDGLMAPADKVLLNDATASSMVGTLVRRDGSSRFQAADPSAAQDVATKYYVDGIATGLDLKASCRAATTANITLSGPQTIDGVSVIAGDRVLVKDQTSGPDNGIYVADAAAWARSADADNSPTTGEVTTGMYTFIEEGTANADAGFVLTTIGTIVLGTTSLSFSQFSGAGQVIAGTALSKTGNTLNVVLGATGSSAAAGNDARFSDSRAPTGAAGGALSGFYPNPTITDLIIANKIDTSTRTLKNAGGVNIVDWQTGAIRNPANALLWDISATNNILFSESGARSIYLNERILADAAQLEALRYNARTLVTTGNKEVVRWETQKLYDTNNVGSIFWNTRQLVTSSNSQAIDWNSYLLYDGTTSTPSLRWDTRDLYDASNKESLKWQSRTLIKSDGLTTSLNWNTLALTGAWTLGGNPILSTVANASLTLIGGSVKITDGTGGQVIVANATGIPVSQTMSGDVSSVSNTGVVTLNASKIVKQSNIVTRETPTGVVDGVNTVFTLSSAPATGTESVYLNGILQDAGATNDYTIGGSTVTFNTAPLTGNKVRVSYIVFSVAGVTSGLTNYWTMDEASGSRFDIIGTSHLAAINNPGNAAGIIGNAVSVTDIGSKYLQVVSNATLAGSAASFSFTGWFWEDPASTTNGCFSKFGAGGGNREYQLGCNGSVFIWLVSNDGATYAQVNSGGVTTSTFYFVYTCYNATTGKIGISVNGGALIETAFAGPVFSSAENFCVGATNTSTTPSVHRGRVDNLKRFNRVLTASEITAEYNAI